MRTPPRTSSASRRVKRLLAGGACVALTGLLATPAMADILYYFATINGAQEVPPTPSLATGTGNYAVDTAANTLDYNITFSGLLGSETAAHFHGPAGPGTNAGIAFILPIGNPKIGTWVFTEGEETLYGIGSADLLYTNIHTNSFPGGEVRGQMIKVAQSLCWGDGSGTACPCGNNGGTGEGCANSLGSGGLLVPSGSNDASNDDLSFVASNLRRNQPVLLFTGDNLINGGNGIAFGGGLRCVGMNVVRLGVRTPDAGGTASWAAGLGAIGGWAGGDTRGFQAWYRDPGGSCGTGFNLSNAIRVTFVP